MTLTMLRSKPGLQLLAVIVLIALGNLLFLSDDRMARSVGLVFPILLGALALWQIQIVQSRPIRLTLTTGIGLSMFVFVLLLASNIWVALTGA
jgi:hypothetical protein